MALPLNTNLPLRLIGIQLFSETEPQISKSLDPGWYPFVQTKEDIGTNRQKRPIVSEDVCPHDFYNIEEGLPRITITALVGKNGSGKSTMLEILFRILNNFTFALFTNRSTDHCDKVQLTRGLHARLYFEQDGINRFIDIADDQVEYYEYIGEQQEKQKIYGLTVKERSVLLNRFFYTISVNYSIYAFNPGDYCMPLNDDIKQNTFEGKWLEYLFHKNDGYFIPLVLTPFRDRGEMNVSIENILAEQRIGVLSLLYHSQDKEFLDEYVPYRLYYEFDKDYKKNKLASFRRKVHYPEIRRSLDVIISHFSQAWQKYFVEQGIDINDQKSDIELFYFAYKTLKICLTYPEYKDLFQVTDMIIYIQTTAKENVSKNASEDEKKKIESMACIKWMNRHTENVNKVVSAIIQDKGRHITAKIFQCLSYLKGDRYKQGNYINADDLIERKYENYDEVMALLPPPFFKSEMHYRKKKDNKERKDEKTTSDDITLRKMSSGEKQLLYSLSYIYYHIKNIASNKQGGKRVVGYHHINLIFDEAELYYHPEFQRVFVKRLLERLAMCHINRTSIRSINIMIVTHSPFVLSDIPESHVLYLGAKDGHKCGRTFGANIYDLLQDSFFLESDIGEVAYSKINELIKLYKQDDSDERRRVFEDKYKEFEFILNHLGEPYLKKTYEFMFMELQELYKPNSAKNMWRQKREDLKRELDRINKLLDNESNQISD